MHGALDVGQGADAVAATAEPQGALLEVERQRDLTLALDEPEHGASLALVACCRAAARLGDLLPVCQVADVEVLAVDVDVPIVVEADAATLLANAVVEVHGCRGHTNKEVGDGCVGRLQKAHTHTNTQTQMV